MSSAQESQLEPVSALLTGGAGYVGSHVNRALTDAGWNTVVLDDLSTGHRGFVRWGELVTGSILDDELLSELFERHHFDAVLHFAGLTSVAESVADPARYERANVYGSRSLLAAMESHDVRTLVFSSSAAVYGHPSHTPISEDAAITPISPYGANKAAVESLLADAEDAWGLRHVSLRYFNAAGADPSADIGEWHDPETHLIPLVLDVASGARANVNVYGTDYPTPDGTCVRDYVHVSDLASAHLRALDYALTGRSGAFNLGTGGGSSVREVIDVVCDVTGRHIPVRECARRPGDPPVLVADSARALDELGWRPTRQNLRTVVEDAWRWHRVMLSARNDGDEDHAERAHD